MHMPFRKSKPLPMRMLNAVAATAGTARMVVRQRTRPVGAKSRNPLARIAHRG
jgi:hypothetical protein